MTGDSTASVSVELRVDNVIRPQYYAKNEFGNLRASTFYITMSLDTGDGAEIIFYENMIPAARLGWATHCST